MPTIPHSPFPLPRSLFPIPRSPFPIPHSFCILHSAFCIALVSAAFAADTNAFWRVSQDSNGVWWAISPVRRAGDSSPAVVEGGKVTFLRGVDHANWNGHYCEALKTNPYRDEMAKKFAGDKAAWRDETLSRLREWGFTMFGAGCSGELENRGFAHTAFLSFGQSFCRKGPEYELSHFEGRPGTAFPNVFHPDWPKFCDERAAKFCAPQKDNQDLFGYFFDNELSWRNRTRGEAALYFATIAAAIRRHDPNHLLLGCRFAGMGGQRFAWEEAGKVCDVLTFNCYPWADIDRGVIFRSRNSTELFADAVAERHAWCGRPLIITEWSFPALDAGLPCSSGAGQRFRTQRERTKATELMARTLLSMPFMIGYDYFMWVDEPALGISYNFPEDSNYGLVNERGEPYPELTAMFTRLHKEAERLHGSPVTIAGEPPTPREGNTPRTAEEMMVAFRKQSKAVDGNRKQSTFEKAGDTYSLRSPSGLALSGRIGGKHMVESIRLGGIDYGPFTAMLYHGKWQDVDRVTAAEWLSERGTLRVTGELRDETKAFRIVCDITPLPAATTATASGQQQDATVLVSVVRVDNIGEAPYENGSVWLRQYAPWAVEKLTGGFRFATNVWKQPDADVWVRASDGAWCGAASTSPLLKIMHYWVTVDKAPHPDASFAPQGNIVLAPGQSYDPKGEMWYVAGYGTGGPEGWRAFLDAFPN